MSLVMKRRPGIINAYTVAPSELLCNKNFARWYLQYRRLGANANTRHDVMQLQQPHTRFMTFFLRIILPGLDLALRRGKHLIRCQLQFVVQLGHDGVAVGANVDDQHRCNPRFGVNPLSQGISKFVPRLKAICGRFCLLTQRQLCIPLQAMLPARRLPGTSTMLRRPPRPWLSGSGSPVNSGANVLCTDG